MPKPQKINQHPLENPIFQTSFGLNLSA